MITFYHYFLLFAKFVVMKKSPPQMKTSKIIQSIETQKVYYIRKKKKKSYPVSSTRSIHQNRKIQKKNTILSMMRRIQNIVLLHLKALRMAVIKVKIPNPMLILTWKEIMKWKDRISCKYYRRVLKKIRTINEGK